MKTTTTHEHPNYKYVKDEKEADGVAYAFLDKNKMSKYPFKFPPLPPDEARVQVLYTGVCHTDSSFVEEHYVPVKQWPFTPGHEVVGIVTAVGSEVKDLKVGDRVGFGPQRRCCEKCEFCQMGRENICELPMDELFSYGDKYWGGYATAIQEPAQYLFKIPESIPDDKAPSLMCAAATCYYPISRYAKKGDNVAVLGMGGLGHMGVQLAKAWGCNVTAFTGAEEKVDWVRELGIDRVVVMNEETLKEEKGKYHVVLNTITIAYDNFDDLVALTRRAGTFCQIGLPKKGNLCCVEGSTLVFGGEINFVGSMFAPRQNVKEMLEFCAKHQVFPECEYYDFDDLPKAYDKVWSSNPRFRCVVNCKDYHKQHIES